MIIEFFDQLFMCKVKGYYFNEVCSLMLGEKYFITKFDFIGKNENTNYPEIFSQFDDHFNSDPILKSYRLFKCFHFRSHVSRYESKTTYQLPERADSDKIPF
jgi:hypothetical protein